MDNGHFDGFYQALASPALAARTISATMRLLIGNSSRWGLTATESYTPFG